MRLKGLGALYYPSRTQDCRFVFAQSQTLAGENVAGGQGRERPEAVHHDLSTPQEGWPDA